MLVMMTDTELQELVARAQAGEKTAIESLLAELRDEVYRLALRMHGPLDAEDLAQEILLKVLTHLGTWRRECAFKTWVMRIASNHLLNARRSRMEGITIEMMLEGNAKLRGIDPATLPPLGDEVLLREEVRLACTQGGVLALDRDLRLAFVLGIVFELPGDVAAEVLEIEPAAFRKRLQRAKDRASEFLLTTCGLVNPAAPCRCEKVVRACAVAGAIDAKNRPYTTQRTCRPAPSQFTWALDEVKDMEARFHAVVKSHPEYAAPETLVNSVREIVASDRYRLFRN